MGEARPIWFINNAASGSNDEAALAACIDGCETGGLSCAHRTVFPEEDLPTPAILDAAGIDLAVIYAGDGTINAALRALAGWSGAVLVLPGGTMNLLYHRLFGDAKMEDAISAVCNGTAKRQRPAVIDSECGKAYAGLLAGPGTAWADVREAMRDNAIIEVAANTREAFAETLNGTRLRCDDPALGRREGYPLILLTPRHGKIEIDAYHADRTAEFLDQLLALVRREFRDGPHDRLGEVEAVVLTDVEGNDFGVLLDGEECSARGAVAFRLLPSEVDLLATIPDA